MPSRTKRLHPGQGFYASVLINAGHTALGLAREEDPLDSELALLRIALRFTLLEHPNELPQIFKIIQGIIRLELARHRISRRAEVGRCESVAGLLKRFGNALEPKAA